VRPAFAVVLAALMVGGSAAGARTTALRIQVWPEGRSGSSVTWTLRCAPAGGTLPGAARACRRLAAMSSPFAPVPKDAVCAEVYGGPQVAFVKGTYRGSRIWAWFRRRDSCETARWKRVGFLLV
jgi:Subtilisin inhibitor-like